jgi:ferredoxin
LANNISLESEHFTALLPTVFDSSEEEQTFLIQHDDKVLHVNNQQSLLTQLQQANLSVNYGCGMGICHQCQCVKKQGIVRDMRTGELSDNAEELIQLCVSQAITNLELQS